MNLIKNTALAAACALALAGVAGCDPGSDEPRAEGTSGSEDLKPNGGDEGVVPDDTFGTEGIIDDDAMDGDGLVDDETFGDDGVIPD